MHSPLQFTSLPDVWNGWPADEPSPALAAAPHNTKTVFFTFDENLACLHASGDAVPLAGFDWPQFVAGLPVIQILRVSGSLSDESLESLQTFLLGAVQVQGAGD